MKDKKEEQTQKPVEMDDSIVKSIRENYLDVYYYQLKQENGLLGEYDLDGKYTIKDSKILDALIALPKQFQEKTDNVVRASVIIGRNVLNFNVELDLAESYCSAQLSLIEIEHGAEEDVKHVQELGQIVEMYSPLFVENVYKQWNIRREPVEIDKEDPIFKLLNAMDKDYEFLIELNELLAQVCVMRILMLLEKCGPEGKKILAEYNEYLKKYGKTPGAPDYYTKLKKKLDELLIKNKAFDMLIKNGGESIFKGVTNPINSIRGIGEPVAVDVKNTQQTKENSVTPITTNNAAKKPKSGGKGGKSNSKGGKGGKDQPKNKADKKKKEPVGSSGKKIEVPKVFKPAPKETTETLGGGLNKPSGEGVNKGPQDDATKSARALVEQGEDFNFYGETITSSPETKQLEEPIDAASIKVEAEKIR